MKTAHILRELRQDRNMSQSEVAKALGIDRTTYVKYEHGGSIKRNLPKLADFFNVSTDYLLGRPQANNRNDQHNSDYNVINRQSTIKYDVASIDKASFFTDHESVLIQKYRHLKPELQKAIDIQLNYFYEINNEL